MFRTLRMIGHMGPKALSQGFLPTAKNRAYFSHKRFDLQNQRPFAEHAKQVLSENPDITFIGVFHSKTKEITLMPAMKENLHLEYNDQEKIIKGKKIRGSRTPLTKEELTIINKEYKLFIPRIGSKVNSPIFLPAHLLMLSYMKSTDNNLFYGFSVMRSKDGSLKIVGNSLSLNGKKPGTIGTITMSPIIQEEIQQIIQSWFSDAINDFSYKKPSA